MQVTVCEFQERSRVIRLLDGADGEGLVARLGEGQRRVFEAGLDAYFEDAGARGFVHVRRPTDVIPKEQAQP